MSATGPSSRPTNFLIGTTRMWGMGLLPLGWANLMEANASELANIVVDGERSPVFARFADLAGSLFGPEPDPEAELARIVAYFRARVRKPRSQDARIIAFHAALVDPDVMTVTDLVERAGLTQRTAERLALKIFGFTPKLLLRRQRFMRSLARYMLDPSLKWIGAIDSQYSDQAQFVRDFREFMEMTPSEYAAMPHPILTPIMQERARYAGSPVQTTDLPEGARIRSA